MRIGTWNSWVEKQCGIIQKRKIECTKQPQKYGRDSGQYLDNKGKKATSSSKAQKSPSKTTPGDTVPTTVEEITL